MLIFTVWIWHFVGVTTCCSISLEMPWLCSGICCFKPPTWQDAFCSPWGSRLVLQDQVNRQARCCQWNEKVRNSLAGNIAMRTCKAICAVWAVAPYFTVHVAVQWKHRSVCKLVFKFQVPSGGVPGTPGLPACLLLQYYSTSFGATSEA